MTVGTVHEVARLCLWVQYTRGRLSDCGYSIPGGTSVTVGWYNRRCLSDCGYSTLGGASVTVATIYQKVPLCLWVKYTRGASMAVGWYIRWGLHKGPPL